MNKLEKIEKKANSMLYNHLWLKYVTEYTFALIVTVISALFFAFGINVFLNPSSSEIIQLVSGGSSGVAQVATAILKFCGVTYEKSPSLIYSLFYVGVNLPLVILAFKGVGKRFGAFTLINIGFVFLFTNILHGKLIDDIALFFSQNGGMVGRALFAGICTGLSSAFAYKIDTSAGGIDIVAYYFSQKKSTTVGKYAIIINGLIVISYSAISIADTRNWAQGISLAFFSVIYLFTVMLVVDFINIRNKKSQVQIITSNKDLTRLLLKNIPHGATIVNARGAYTNEDRYIVYMVVSSTEIRHVIKVVKQLDPMSFVHVTTLNQVYGHFFIKPVK